MVADFVIWGMQHAKTKLFLLNIDAEIYFGTRV